MDPSTRGPGRHHSRWRSRLARIAVGASAAVLLVVGSAGTASAAADYTQSVTQLNASQAVISFTPTTPARYVDVHYLSPTAGQQNFRMTNNAGTWQKTVSSLPAGFVLEYWFTYEKNGPQFDTPHFFYTQGGAGTVATPTFSPPGGTYTTTQSVTLSTTTSGASIRYTLDGSTPTASSTLYTGPIGISATTTVKAIGIASGLTNSAVATATYTISVAAVATPTFNPPGGTYTSAQSVTLSTTTSGASIRYTLDGSTPTASSTLYTGPIGISATTTVKAIGIASGLTNSAVATATYTISVAAVATPTFNPPGGTYPSAQSVAISTTTAGASIRYTLDGSTPTASSTLYTGPITVSATTTVKAIGIASGLTNSAVATATYTIGTTGSCPTQSDTPDFGPNVRVFDPSMSAATIQAQLDADFNAQKSTQTAQFASGRVAHLFKPGTYAVHDNVGFYTSVAGLGQNPDDVMINGDVTVDAFNASDAGNATQNFWRSAENLAITPSSGSDRWAVAQAAPFRRIDVHGGLQLYPASFGFASGGYIADTKVSGQAASASQQQWYTRDSSLGSWNGGVWNMVFSGVSGAPANTFPSPPETTVATTPVSRDVPYLYVDGTGKYRVFLPSLRTNASGPSWASGSTPGTSVPMSQFYVVKAADTASTINAALASGCNLFFTPGVWHLNQTLNVTRANTVVLGIGYPTLIPDNGVNAMQVSDVDGVRIKGLLFDAGTMNSAALLTVGPSGSTADHTANPTTLQDVFYRIGGGAVGKATTSLVVNSNNVIIDHTWAWRADHGNAGAVGWTVNTADTGVLVNGNNVLATGLFVEHYQKYEVVWNGQGGKTIFFQNEMPYDVPDQASWMNPNGLNGYAAYKVGANVTTHEAWGLGSYCFFNTNPAVSSYHAFEVPNAAGVRFHSVLTVSLNFKGTITHVINDTGATTPSGTSPSNVVSYP